MLYFRCKCSGRNAWSKPSAIQRDGGQPVVRRSITLAELSTSTLPTVYVSAVPNVTRKSGGGSLHIHFGSLHAHAHWRIFPRETGIGTKPGQVHGRLGDLARGIERVDLPGGKCAVAAPTRASRSLRKLSRAGCRGERLIMMSADRKRGASWADRQTDPPRDCAA